MSFALAGCTGMRHQSENLYSFCMPMFLVDREEGSHGSNFLGGAAGSFLCAWQSQSLTGSENRHAATPIKEVGNESVINYLRRKSKCERAFFFSGVAKRPCQGPAGPHGRGGNTVSDSSAQSPDGINLSAL